jgi:5S rRNA maturation endonuclease (ribonuclease M5)
MKTRDQIISENPIEPYLASRGIVLKGSGVERLATCPWHSDSTPSFSVNVEKQAWVCRAGCGGGSIIDLMARFEGLDPKVIMKRLGETPEGYKPSHSGPPAQPKAQKGVDTAKTNKDAPTATQDSGRPKLVKAYDFRNAKGELVFQECRLEPKGFRQRRPNPLFHVAQGHSKDNPQWIWDMVGVDRVLYNLPKVLKTKPPGQIWVVEGPKDSDSVNAIGAGMVATTNVGGAGKWLEAYSEVLRDKDVVLCGDNDEPGRKHVDAVLESLAGKAKSVRVVTIPAAHKDVTDFLESLPGDPETRFNALQKLVDEAPLFDRGVNLPVKSMAELEQEYIHSIKRAMTHSLNLGTWLETLGNVVRPLVAGEVLTIIGATASAKTACGQNLAFNARPMKVLFFEQELPGSLTFERFAALATRIDSKQVFHYYASGESHRVEWQHGGALDHVLTCTRSRMTTEGIEELIIKSELKIGERPALVIVDYLQLMGGKGERRERIAGAAEGLKSVAKNTNTIVVMLSQISRKGKDASPEVSLEDGKEAGEIENSSGVVLGVWRDEKDETLLWLRVLKNTKGIPGRKIPCDFDGAKMLITERPENAVSAADKPKPKQPHKNE